MTSRLTLVNAQPAAAFLDNDVCVVAKTLCLTAHPLEASVGAGLPWPVVRGAEVVVFAASVTVLLTP